MSIVSRGPETSMLEVKKQIDYLIGDKYKYRETINAPIIDGVKYEDYAISFFEKNIPEYETFDGSVPDNIIKVLILFDKRSDYENFTKDEQTGDPNYGKPDKFIEGLISEIPVPTGGTRRKKIKTSRNNRKSSNRYRK